MWYFDLLLKVTFVNIKDWTYQIQLHLYLKQKLH